MAITITLQLKCISAISPPDLSGTLYAWILIFINYKLSETERKGLLLAVKARAAQSVIGGYYTASIEPENREYLMSECSIAEKLLHEIVDEKFNGMMVHDL